MTARLPLRHLLLLGAIHILERQPNFTDIFPTGWSAIDWANVRGGETVAIFGAGPVGLKVQKAAWLRGAARVSHRPGRVSFETVRRVNKVETINPHYEDPVEIIRELTSGLGADPAGMEDVNIKRYSLFGIQSFGLIFE